MISVQASEEQVEIGPTVAQDQLVNYFRLQVVLNISDVPYFVSRPWSCAHLIRGDEILHVLLHHLPLYGQTLDIRRERFGSQNILQCVTFAEVYLDQPSRQHHPLRAVLAVSLRAP
jgi:hypothetical protein